MPPSAIHSSNFLHLLELLFRVIPRFRVVEKLFDKRALAFCAGQVTL